MDSRSKLCENCPNTKDTKTGIFLKMCRSSEEWIKKECLSPWNCIYDPPLLDEDKWKIVRECERYDLKFGLTTRHHFGLESKETYDRLGQIYDEEEELFNRIHRKS